MASDNGPETIAYSNYDSGTGVITVLVDAATGRGLNGTTDVAHANGAKVGAGYSVSHIKEFCGARAYLASTLGTTVAST